MIKLSYQHINETPMEQALSRLSTMPMDLKTGYTVAKIKNKVMAAIKERRKSYTADVMALATKDETTGKVVHGPDGMPLVAPENQDKLAKLAEDVTTGELTIDWRPIQFSEVAHCKLTPNEIDALSPFITGLDEAVKGLEVAPTEEAASS